MEKVSCVDPELLLASSNPLLQEFYQVQTRITHFKERVKEFYFWVILSQHECPECGGDLRMVGQSQCVCVCGNLFDPTLVFQRSPCCESSLVRKTFHYACSRCYQTVSSKFLFDERLFDAAYFRGMMRESRAQAKRKKEALKRFLVESRSKHLLLLEEPCLVSIPGLTDALNDFVGSRVEVSEFVPRSGFRMNDYRTHILSVIGFGSRLFSDISPLIEDYRRDRIGRFITLVFMCQSREVALTQYGNDIFVERISDETHF